jgi:hypothetical protein
MEPWSGREISDIVYDDIDKKLREWFIDNGYVHLLPGLILVQSIILNSKQLLESVEKNSS